MKRLSLILLMALCAPAFADCVLQEDTADSAFALGPFLDSTDGITPETALTITSSEVLLKKKGSTTFAAKNESSSCTHRSNGWYSCPLDATDLNTAGNLIVAVTESGAVPVWRECMVVASDYYDILDATTAVMTSRQAGAALATTIATVSSQTVFTLTAGASNNDAYNTEAVKIVGGTEECHQYVSDYVGSTKTLTIGGSCPFTVAIADEIYIYPQASGRALGNLDTTVNALNDISTAEVFTQAQTALSDVGLDTFLTIGTADSGTTSTLVDAALTQANDYWNDDWALVVHFSGGDEIGCVTDFVAGTDTLSFQPAMQGTVSTETYTLVPFPSCEIRSHMIATGAIWDGSIASGAINATAIDTAAIDADAIATNAITADKIAADAIGESEIATDAITDAEIAANSIGASEIATDAIGAAEIAAAAITSDEIAANAIGASELAADAVDEILDEVIEDQGSTYSLREAMSVLLSEAVGTCTYTQGTRTWVCKDPSGTETRFTLVYGSELDGDRSTSTLAPVTP